MNSKGEANRSVRMTRRRLSEALVTLLLQKPVREITVRELTDLAKVSRGTFYFHYSDIYELMDRVEQDQIQELERLMDDILPRLDEDSTPESLCMIYRYLDENDGICSALLGPNGDPAFRRRLQSVIAEHCVGYIAPSDSVTPAQRYMVAFAVQGCFGSIDVWLENGKPETPEKLADITWQAVRAVKETARRMQEQA
ncbi:MAG: TetR/AcrR family transcriptional regulator [Gemmiger sp.]|uniref:TetR/AcrR family transcriptional regulator n=1 Tax=Gemmiger sp. TaxID=2049027 RepID=UPI002E75BDB8|nr:TetR/AcrR family transcriptional regulator [Gemmiger sp.]MEE0801192.1 TetR/AcrR family transcriptional regulator [Gemmiger sp.]